jgi:Spore germination protein GerPC
MYSAKPGYVTRINQVMKNGNGWRGMSLNACAIRAKQGGTPPSGIATTTFSKRFQCLRRQVHHIFFIYSLRRDPREVASVYAYLWDRLNRLEQEIASLRKENEALKKKLASIQPVTIERIEYKIQELSIKTLSGTLNVGLTATGDDKSVARIIEQIQSKETDKKKKEPPPKKGGSSISIVNESAAEKEKNRLAEHRRTGERRTEDSR